MANDGRPAKPRAKIRMRIVSISGIGVEASTVATINFFLLRTPMAASLSATAGGMTPPVAAVRAAPALLVMAAFAAVVAAPCFFGALPFAARLAFVFFI